MRRYLEERKFRIYPFTRWYIPLKKKMKLSNRDVIEKNNKWNVECFIILIYPEQYVQTLYLLCNKLILKNIINLQQCSIFDLQRAS